MSKNDVTRSSKFLQVSARLDLTKGQKWLIKLFGILAGLILCALVCTIINPGTFFAYFQKVIQGCFTTPRKILSLLEETAVLFLIALALAPAFKMKFWNIGAEGQVLMGALGCVIIMKFLGPTFRGFDFATIVLELIVSILFGVAWGLIPAVFKAYFGANETLFTLMMNYIAKGIILLLTAIWYPKGSGIMPSFDDGILPMIGSYDYIINIIVIALVAIAVSLYLLYSKHGYEISVIGGSENTARYVGINVKLVTIRTMILSGALCGLVGFLITSGANHSVNELSAGGRGFTAILICWLSNFDPLEMLATSFVVALINNGSKYACDQFHSAGPFENIVIGIFFFTIIASTFFLSYKVKLNFGVFKKKKQDDENKEVA